MDWRKKRKLKGRYDSTADSYDSRYENIQEKKVEAIKEYLKGSTRILDVGCGTGSLLEEVSSDKELAVGVDFSIEMLRRARERLGDAKLILADADNLPFQDGTFDLVVSLTLLQNVPEPSKTIREMARVVETGGLILVTSLEKKHKPHEIEEWMDSAGLKPLRAEGIPNSEDVLCVGRNEK